MQPNLFIERSFPTWHFAMLNDQQRNDVIEAGIRESDVVDKAVFEIGTGAGLTALMFARQGAKKVITCEVDQQLAKIARETIEENGYSHIIDVIPKSSTEAINSGAINFVPDIIFTETIDCGVVNEGYHAVKRDISRIARKNTKILPQKILQFGRFIECEEIYKLNNVKEVSALDMSILNRYSTSSYFPVRAANFRPKYLTSVRQLHKYDYLHDKSEPDAISVVAQCSGTCHGLISHFEAYFGRLFVANDSSISHWHQAFHPLREPFKMESGNTYTFHLSDTGILEYKEVQNA